MPAIQWQNQPSLEASQEVAVVEDALLLRAEQEFLRESDATVSLTTNAKEAIEQNMLSTQQLNNSTHQSISSAV